MDQSRIYSAEEKAAKAVKGREIFDQLRSQKAEGTYVPGKHANPRTRPPTPPTPKEKAASRDQDTSNALYASIIQQLESQLRESQDKLSAAQQKLLDQTERYQSTRDKSATRDERILQLEAQLNEERARNSALQQQETKVSSQYRDFLKKYASLESSLDHAQRDLRMASAENVELKQQISAIKRDQMNSIELHKQEVTTQTRAISNLESTILNLRQELSSAQRNSQHHASELERLRHSSSLHQESDQQTASQIQNLRQESVSQQQRIASLDRENIDLKKQLSDLQLQLQTEAAETIRNSRKAREGATAKAELSAQIQQLETKIEQQSAQLYASNSQVEILQRQLKSMTQDSSLDISQELTQVQETLRDAMQENSSMRTKIQKLESELYTTLADNQRLTQQITDITEQFKSTQTQLHSNHAKAIHELEIQRANLEEQIGLLESSIQLSKDDIKTLQIQNKLLLKQNETQVQDEAARWSQQIQDLQLEKEDLKIKHAQAATEILILSQQKESLESTVRALSDQADGQVTHEFSRINQLVLDLQGERARLLSQIDEHLEEKRALLESAATMQGQIQILTDRINSLQNERHLLEDAERLDWETQIQALESRLVEFEDTIRRLRTENVLLQAHTKSNPAVGDSNGSSSTQDEATRTLEIEVETLRKRVDALSEENQHYADTIESLMKSRRSASSQLPNEQSPSADADRQSLIQQVGFDSAYLTVEDIPLLLDTIRRLEVEVTEYTEKFEMLSAEKERVFFEKQHLSASSLRADEMKIRTEAERLDLLDAIENDKELVESLTHRNEMLSLQCQELEKKLESHELRAVSSAAEAAELARQIAGYQSSLSDANHRIEELLQDRTQLNDRWIDISGQLRAEKLRVDSLGNEKLELASKVTELSDVNERLQGENARLVLENKRLYSEKMLSEQTTPKTTESEPVSRDLLQKLEEQYSAIQLLEQENLATQLDITRMQYLVEEKDRDILALKGAEAELKARTERLQVRLDEVIAANDELQQSLANAVTDKLGLEEEREAFALTKSYLEKQLQELRSMLSSGQASRSALAVDQMPSQGVMTVLAQEKAALEALLETTNKKLDEARNIQQRDTAKIHSFEMRVATLQEAEREATARADLQSRKLAKIQEDYQGLMQTTEAMREQHRQFTMQRSNYDADHHRLVLEHAELQAKLRIEQERIEMSKKQRLEVEKTAADLTLKLEEITREKEETIRSHKRSMTSMQMKLRERCYAILRIHATLRRLLQQSSPGKESILGASYSSDESVKDMEDIESLEKRVDSVRTDSVIDGLELSWSQIRQSITADRDALKRLLVSSLNEASHGINHLCEQISSDSTSVASQTRKSTWVDSGSLKTPEECAEFVKAKLDELHQSRERLLREILTSRSEVEAKARELRKMQVSFETSHGDMQRDLREKSDSRELQRKLIQQISSLTEEVEELKRYRTKTMGELESLRGVESRYGQMRKVWEQEIALLMRERDDAKKVAEDAQKLLNESAVTRSGSLDQSGTTRLRESILQEQKDLLAMIQRQKDELETLRSETSPNLRREGDGDVVKLKSMELRIQTVEQELQLQRDYSMRERKAFEKERLCFEEEKKQLKEDLLSLEKRMNDEKRIEELRAQRLQEQLEKAEQRNAEATASSAAAWLETDKVKSEIVSLQNALKAAERKTREYDLRIEEGAREKHHLAQRLAEIEKANAGLKKYHQELIETRTKHEALQFSMRTMEEEIKRKQRKIDSLTQQVDTYSQENHKLKDQVMLGTRTTPQKQAMEKGISLNLQAMDSKDGHHRLNDQHTMLGNVQALIDSSLSLLGVRVADSSVSKRMEALYLHVEEIVRKKYRTEHLEKEHAKVKEMLHLVSKHRQNLVEQKRYLGMQLEMALLRSGLSSYSALAGKSKARKPPRRRLKGAVRAVMAHLRIRSTLFAMKKKHVVETLPESQASLDQYLMQLRQKDEIIRALRAQIQTFEGQVQQQRQVATEYQQLQNKYLALLSEQKDSPAQSEKVVQLDALVKAKETTISALRKQLADLNKSTATLREDLRGANDRNQQLQRDLQAATTRETSERHQRQKAESENRLLQMRIDHLGSTQSSSRFAHLSPHAEWRAPDESAAK
eukprot:TRINITY_DN1448_c0_g2_i5.p1 TRINITY_DN1448_c0_g2~~TRINITY_DN1448_c0_g2_i5.p1  ORF type:complete len:2123 (+),score=576.74 TRINITY_DN1448_c0_g2_i5:26-6370(+)